MGKKIAIIGTTASMMDAPYNDKSWEIWGLNGAYQGIPRWDRWFDLHDLEVLKKCHEPRYFDFLKAAGNKLMLKKKYEEYPEAQVFPYEKLIDKYGRYFTNTVAWLVALAIEEKPEEIGIWGVNMAQDTEYAHQRPSCEYYIGLARGLGIKVTIPPSSEMMKCSFLYGIEKTPAFLAKLPDKKREIQCNYNEVMLDIDKSKADMNHLNGYVHALSDIELKLKDDKLSKDIKKLIEEKKNSAPNEATQINNKLQQLIDQKKYWEGARDLTQYIIMNWSV